MREPTSVPMAAAARPSRMATAFPQDEPAGSCRSQYTPVHSPPMADQLPVLLKFANSERFVFPRMTAPASLSFETTVDSYPNRAPLRAYEPAILVSPRDDEISRRYECHVPVVSIASSVQNKSLRRMGMPFKALKCVSTCSRSPDHPALHTPCLLPFSHKVITPGGNI